jgi:glycosyltransferase involved in cell wall biosynthesis
MPNEYRLSQFRRGVAHFVAVSDFLRDAWIRAGLDPDRVSVISNAVPPSEYPRGGLLERAAARQRLGLSVDSTIVLCYGRIILEKGIGTLLEAWARLGMSADQAQLVLVGSPSPFESPDLECQLRGMDASSIRWFSMQSDVIPFLHAADLVVFPTWLDEGFGRVVIEGMATGRPVIASRVGAVPEILSGSMDRFLVEPKNPDELASRIRSLLEWREKEPDLGTECADWIDERYPYAQHISDLESVLDNCRKRRRGTRSN